MLAGSSQGSELVAGKIMHTPTLKQNFYRKECVIAFTDKLALVHADTSAPSPTEIQMNPAD